MELDIFVVVKLDLYEWSLGQSVLQNLYMRPEIEGK
jgi:hypothetical protein